MHGQREAPNATTEGLAVLAPTRERQSHAHRAEGAGIEPMAGDESRDRLAPEIEGLLPVYRKNRLALYKVLDLLAQPYPASPAARRRPERNSSRSSRLRYRIAGSITTGVIARSRLTVSRASSSRPRCA
jgi:hypothetical protein